MSAVQRLHELFSELTNYERTRTRPVAWSLDTMHVLLRGDGARPPGGTWVQVAGSKGKGTTVAYLEALARGAGLRCGVYTSPHLVAPTERVRIDGRDIDADALVAALSVVLERARAAAVEPSFFEAITAAAVRLFGAAALDLVVLEVGLGGRLDATTAVPVDGNILTRIEREHTDILGDSLEGIAEEKARSLRPGAPAWFCADPRTGPVIRRVAAEVGADLREPVSWRETPDADELCGDLLGGGAPVPFRIPGASRFELPALALAHACLRSLFPGHRFTTDPVARPALPGRFEVWPRADGFDLILDGAHTPASSQAVVAELQRRYPGRPVAMLFGSARGKLWQEGLRELGPVVDKVLVTAVEGIPGEDPAAVAAWLRTQGRPAEVVDGPGAGLAALLRCAAVRVVVGSFYLVGAVRSMLSRE